MNLTNAEASRSFLPGNDQLIECFYRSNYSVFRKNTIAQFDEADRSLWERLLAEYQARWPIASAIDYEISAENVVGREWDDEDEDYRDVTEDIDCSDAIAFPCSLMYSMPDDWQQSMVKICRASSYIWEDDSQYCIHSIVPFYSDPFQDRHSRWESDNFVEALI